MIPQLIESKAAAGCFTRVFDRLSRKGGQDMTTTSKIYSMWSPFPQQAANRPFFFLGANAALLLEAAAAGTVWVA